MSDDHGNDLADELLSEFLNFYVKVCFPKAERSRRVSGVLRDGRQFVYGTDGLGLDHVSRPLFLAYICQVEDLIGYVQASPMLMANGEPPVFSDALEIASCSQYRAIVHQYYLNNNTDGSFVITNKKMENTTIENYWHPVVNFIRTPKNLDDASVERFSKLWASIRPNIFWRVRQ